MLKKISIFCIFFLIMVVLLYGRTMKEKDKIYIDIGYQSVTAQTWGAVVMKQSHIFEKLLEKKYPNNEFIVTWHDETSGAIINQNMISLKYQIGFMGDLPCLINGYKGLTMEDYSSVLVCFDGRGEGGINQTIVAKEDSGITGILDLTGKTVGVPIGSSAHKMLLDLLERNDILEEVSIIHAEINVAYQMLENGHLDAICVWEPYGEIILNKDGIFQIASGETTGIDYLDGVMVNKEWAEENTEYLCIFLEALHEAQDILKNDVEEATRIISLETGIDQMVVMRIIERITWDMTIKAEDTVTLNDGMKFLEKLGLLEVFDLSDIVDERYLNHALQ